MRTLQILSVTLPLSWQLGNPLTVPRRGPRGNPGLDPSLNLQSSGSSVNYNEHFWTPKMLKGNGVRRHTQTLVCQEIISGP